MRGILFDLDGTLLDLDLGVFLERYFGALTRALAEIVGSERAPAAMDAMGVAVRAMSLPHEGTNRDAFNAEFARLAGVDLDEHWPVFERFYEDVFPALGEDLGPVPGAAEAVKDARTLGMRVAIATNPIFPRRAIEHRLAWAGIEDLDGLVITSYEVMRATKPAPAYFRQTAEMLGVDVRECLMVGDDPGLDLPAADVGMKTFFVGTGDSSADFSGDLAALRALLPRLADPPTGP